MSVSETIIHVPSPASGRDTIIDLKEKKREFLHKVIPAEDRKWGYNLDKKYNFRNNYDNDDYLYVAGILRNIRDRHRITFFNPYEKVWHSGYAEIPYIHLEFTEFIDFQRNEDGTLARDENGMYVPDDKSLNMGVKPPEPNNTYTLQYNYYWLQQYLLFLQKIFDDNEELIFELPEEVTCEDGVERNTAEVSCSYGGKKELFKIMEDLRGIPELRSMIPTLELYAHSTMPGMNVPIPAITFWKNTVTEETKVLGWGIYDKDRNVFSIDMKKKIYNTSGFAEYFKERQALISEIFYCSLRMILSHEVAHVANGHWNLRMEDKEYSMQQDVMLLCEMNADRTAMIWLLNELLYDLENPYSIKLSYRRNDLIYLWAVRIFSAYLSLSWGFREDERIWTVQTFEEFEKKRNLSHPPYQFRVYQVINAAFSHLEHMCSENQGKEYQLTTFDDTLLDKDLVQAVKDKTLNMIYSFEASFRESFQKDERETLEKLQDSLIVEKKSRPKTANEVPFLFVYLEQAAKEMERLDEGWPEVRGRLKQAGVYNWV